MLFLSRPCGRAAALAALAFLPCAARAHIQWFATIDPSGRPLDPSLLWHAPAFVALAILAAAVLALAGFNDARLTAVRPARAPGPRAAAVARLGLAASLFATMAWFHAAPVILTPDQPAATPWTTALQAGIVVAALVGHARLTAVGLLMLMAEAAASNGAFRLLDYAVFLGLAAYVHDADRGADAARRALLVLRASLGFTLMWAGVQKWLYPEWTTPLLCGSGRALLMGFTPDFFLQAAGLVEFCLAFVVVVGGTAARVACGVLAAMMLAAIPMFGAVDAIGHAPFLLVLALVGTTDNPLARVVGASGRPARQGLRWAALFGATLAGLPRAYEAGHRWAYDRVAAPVLLPLHHAALLVPLAALATLAAALHLRDRSSPSTTT